MEGFDAFCAALSTLRHLKCLSLEYSRISEDEALVTREVMGAAEQLQRLPLSEFFVMWCAIGQHGACDLAANLHNVTHLILHDVLVGGASRLAAALAQLPKLRCLCASNLRVYDSTELADVILTLSQLTRLALDGSSIGDAFATVLAAQLQSLPLLEWLDVSDTKIGADGLDPLMAAAARHAALLQFKASGVRVSLCVSRELRREAKPLNGAMTEPQPALMMDVERLLPHVRASPQQLQLTPPECTKEALQEWQAACALRRRR